MIKRLSRVARAYKAETESLRTRDICTPVGGTPARRRNPTYMHEELSYKLPRGQRCGQGSSSVLQYLVDDLRVKDSQPVVASPRGDLVSVQPLSKEPSRATPAVHAND